MGGTVLWREKETAINWLGSSIFICIDYSKLTNVSMTMMDGKNVFDEQ